VQQFRKEINYLIIIIIIIIFLFHLIVACLLEACLPMLYWTKSTGFSFACDLNNNIAAPWPASSSVSSLALCAPGKCSPTQERTKPYLFFIFPKEHEQFDISSGTHTHTHMQLVLKFLF
jgi:hypothetical protein